jgi:phosphatidate cytidylyltransferase
MLKTRLWMGALLIGLALLILLEERWFSPWYPFLFLALSAACLLGTRELLSMLDPASRPSYALCMLGVFAILVANWRQPLVASGMLPAGIEVWHLIGFLFTTIGIAAFLIEMYRFRGPDRIVERVSQTLLVVFYLAVLPSFFMQLRWIESAPNGGFPSRATLAIALTVFVPKCGDIGAYFTGKFLTGRLLGRHHMTPILSPKKTWQGLVGGLLTSIGVAVGVYYCFEVLPGVLVAVAFGLTVGISGVFGDLAESLIKRDRQTKDASTSVPGFGGVLDVIDSLLFAAPVAYLWLAVL